MGINLPAGRELDALVARHVLKIRVYDSWEQAAKDNEDEFKGYPYAIPDEDEVTIYDSGPTNSAFRPSTDITDAWQVMERLNTLLRTYTERDGESLTPEEYALWIGLLTWPARVNSIPFWDKTAKEAAHRICVEALEAIGYKEG